VRLRQNRIFLDFVLDSRCWQPLLTAQHPRLGCFGRQSLPNAVRPEAAGSRQRGWRSLVRAASHRGAVQLRSSGYEDRKREAWPEMTFPAVIPGGGQQGGVRKFLCRAVRQLLALLNSLCLADCRAGLRPWPPALPPSPCSPPWPGAREDSAVGAAAAAAAESCRGCGGPRLCQAALRTLRTLVSAQQLLTGPPEPQLPTGSPRWLSCPDTGRVSSLNFLLSLLPCRARTIHLLSPAGRSRHRQGRRLPPVTPTGAVDSLAPLLLAGPAPPRGFACLAGMCLALAAGHRAAVGAAGSRLQDALLHRVLPERGARVQSRSEAVPLAWRCLSLDTLAIVF
uniref:Secreted protein n=1 Tax=Macrostomum lignano TaxID=282301 RepID=A0A1I8F6L7_9PLAT